MAHSSPPPILVITNSSRWHISPGRFHIAQGPPILILLLNRSFQTPGPEQIQILSINQSIMLGLRDW